MARVVIVGAGGVGRVVAHACAGAGEPFADLLLASRRESSCKAIAEDVRKRTGKRIETAALDAENIDQTADLLKRFEADMLIHVALPYQDLTLMEACLEAGVHYLDTANYEPKEEASFAYGWQWNYHDRFLRAGRVAILGCGFDPGVTGVFTAYAAKHYFDELHTLDIVDCNAGEHGHPFATNFNAEINIREITQKGKYYEHGAWIETPPQGLSRPINYPHIGTRMSYLVYHEELESLVKHFSSLQRARFWMTFGEQYLSYLRVIMDIGMGSIKPILYEGRHIVPLQFLQAVLPAETLGASYKGETSIGCALSGTQDGKEKRYYVYNNCSHEEAYQKTGAHAVAFTTGVPAMIGAKLLLEGTWKKEAGVFNVEEFDPDPFMAALSTQGLPWHEVHDQRPGTRLKHNDMDSNAFPSPCYIIDEQKLLANIAYINKVAEAAQASAFLALKAFALWPVFGHMKAQLAGATASSLYEARLCYEELGKKAHTYAVAYKDEEFEALLPLSSHMTFNTLAQYAYYKPRVDAHTDAISCGLRVNPEHSEVKIPLYNPAMPQARLGMPASKMPPSLPPGIRGLHFHTLCESNSDAFSRTLAVFERHVAPYLSSLDWVNVGGGHFITHPSYDAEHLIAVLRAFGKKYGVQVWIEPGAAFVLDAGVLATTVLDIVDHGGARTAIIDASFTCHMPDCLEMPYRPRIRGAAADTAKQRGHMYRIGGLSCLAGDFLEAYAFEQPLRVGDRVVFEDMLHYTLVQTTFFNGLQHPSIGIWTKEQTAKMLKTFDYGDYKGRWA